MYKYNKLLVGLDRSEVDIDVVKAAADVCRISGSKKVYFVNVIKELNLPESIKKEFPDLLHKALEERQKEIEELVESQFFHEDIDVAVEVVVEEGPVTKTLLKYCAQEQVDLVILGRKNRKGKNVNVVVTRLARRCARSLLIIPEGSRLRTEHILVPTDFSDYSKSAMEKAISLARKSEKDTQLIVQNVYSVPTGYHYTGKTYDDFAEVMKKHAKKEFLTYTQKMKLDGLQVKQLYTLDKDEDIISDIHKAAKKEHAGLIVIGAKGRSATTALFIGSKAERLIQLNSEIPMLVVRPKGKIAGLMEYLKEI